MSYMRGNIKQVAPLPATELNGASECARYCRGGNYGGNGTLRANLLLVLLVPNVVQGNKMCNVS